MDIFCLDEVQRLSPKLSYDSIQLNSDFKLSR